jgi:hypothetical protein
MKVCNLRAGMNCLIKFGGKRITDLNRRMESTGMKLIYKGTLVAENKLQHIGVSMQTDDSKAEAKICSITNGEGCCQLMGFPFVIGDS